ncbi:unnamed protein product [Malus baccata var. baccata]
MVKGLQRSERTFRRQGSSRLISWGSAKSNSTGPTMERSRSIGERSYQTIKKVFDYGICSTFGKLKLASACRLRPNKRGFFVDFAVFKEDEEK